MINTTSTFQHVSNTDKSYNLKMMYEKPIVQVSTAVVLTIFAIIFFAAFAIRPTLSTIAELIKKIDDQEIVVDKLNKKSAALATAQSEYLLVESKIPNVVAAIPPEHNIDLLLKQIEGVAAVLQIPIESIQVDTIDLPTDPTTSRVVDGMVEQPLSLTINSSYASLRQMLKMVRDLRRFISIESISFSTDDEVENPGLLSLTVRFHAYYLSSEMGDASL